MERNPYSNISRFLSIDDIKTIILNPEIRIVSFDIFDTLLVRPSMVPTDIFYLLDHLFPELPKKLSKMRLTAEGRLGSPNATFAEIWSFISKCFHVDPELANALAQAEIKLESQLLTVRKDVMEIYQCALNQGKRIIAVSDMYLSSEILLNILHAKGYIGIEQVYVSCEHKRRKDGGELYGIVLEGEKLADPSQMVHLGDNFHSDYRIPLEHGITAIYYPSIWDIMLSENSWWKKAFQNQRISEDPFIRMLYSFAFLYAYNDGYRPDENVCFGTIKNFAQLYLAPLLVSAALDLINNETIQAKYQGIYFAARDGYVPLSIYRKVAENVSAAIPAHYLYASRSALSFSKYRDFFDFYDHFKPSTSYSLRHFVEYFIVDDELKSKLCSGLSRLESAYDLSEDKVLARRALSRFKPELDRYFAQQKELAHRYYTDAFRGAGERLLVFDCGYSGSISAGLMAACKHLRVDKYYLWQTEDNVAQDRKNGTRTFCRFQSNTPLGVNLIVEECCSPAQGTHIGFAEKDGAIFPVQERFPCSAAMRDALNSIKEEAQRYTAEFCRTFLGYLNGFSITREDVFGKVGYEAFLRSPSGELRLFDCFKFPDAYMREEPDSLCAKVQDFYDESLNYPTSFSGTGFLLKENYAQIPERRLLEEARRLRLGIHVHLYNKHFFPEVYGHLKGFPAPFDLFVTVTDEKFVHVADKVFRRSGLENLRQLKILLVENRGRDIAPWLIDTAKYQKDYDLFCHLHGKESPQNEKMIGNGWRDYLFLNLLHKYAAVDILNLFVQNERLGVVFPEPYAPIADIFNHGRLKLLGTMGEDKTVLELLAKMGLGGKVERHDILYSIGTMMWYRPAAMRLLFDLGLESEDFPEEPIGVGGTIAHAIERLPPLAAQGAGYTSAFFTEFPWEHCCWLDWQMEFYENAGKMAAWAPATIGLKGALSIFLHKHIPFLFRNCAEIHYQNSIGVRGALAAYLSKLIHRLLRA